MKRTLEIFIMVLVIAVGIVITLYFLRQNKALQQHVHPSSQAVLSISLDDLLLDNAGQFFKRHAADSITPTSGLLDPRNWWGAGVQIPAQIHFFTMKDHPFAFFTIQKIEHPKKWNNFLKEHLADSIAHMTYAGQQLTRAQLSSNVSAVYDRQYILLCYTALNQDNDHILQTIWEEKGNWIYVHDLSVDIPENPPAHIAYRHTDGTFHLFADIADKHVKLAGDWHLKIDVPAISQIRKTAVNDPFISLWSTLPLANTPLIIHCLSTFSDMDPDKLINNTNDYWDLYISADMTAQQDTAIVYDYDEDFNSIEKEEIREIKAPVVESVWKGKEALATVLPEKLFYRFNKSVTDSLIRWTTRSETTFSPTFVAASSPFHMAIDFRHLPASWTNDLLHAWQQRSLQITLETSRLAEQTLRITGNIHYKER